MGHIRRAEKDISGGRFSVSVFEERLAISVFEERLIGSTSSPGESPTNPGIESWSLFRNRLRSVKLQFLPTTKPISSPSRIPLRWSSEPPIKFRSTMADRGSPLDLQLSISARLIVPQPATAEA
ncbi:hypothetical protein U1Q18_000195 [Sarracenia purpurea var. burkii]